MFNHLERTILFLILGTGWLTMILVASVMFWPVKTLVINTPDPIPVVNKVVLPGERLEYELDFCKYTDKRAVVYRALVDGQIITLRPTEGALPEGCRKTTVNTTIIPTTINPGEYYLDVYLEYRLNFLRTETVHYRTEYFRVGELPEEEKPVEVLEREGKTIYVPYPVHTNEPAEPANDPDIHIETTTVVPRDTNQDVDARRDENEDNGEDPPAEPQQRPSLIDGVRGIIGL